jgi:hypothetical protein
MYVTLFGYIGLFLVWLLLVGSCLQHTDGKGWNPGVCGQNTLTQVVRVIHAPVVAVLVR